MTTLRRSLAVLGLTGALFLTGCPFNPIDSLDETPSWLLTAWITAGPGSTARTYDFTQAQAAGRRAVEIRTWQQIGTLGWQSNQGYTADFTASNDRVSLVAPTGYREDWVVVQRESHAVLLQNQNTGSQAIWYNCMADGWPATIRGSMRACR